MTARAPSVSIREYDREFTTSLGHRVRRRVGLDTERRTVTRFVVQLEYHVWDDRLTVVRFDHDPASEHGHDVTEEGVHMDDYRYGERLRRSEQWHGTER